jgi:multidrug efflux pump subunit AcrA (membrane-fusion protein)
LDQFLVTEGAAVKQGQTVAKLKSPDIETKLRDKQQILSDRVGQLALLCQVSPDQVDGIEPSMGITLTAPIDGRVTGLDTAEGKKITQGQIIAKIVDDSKYKVSLKLFEAEFKKVKAGQKVILSFPDFSGTYDGVITEVNSNKLPFNEENSTAKTFVYAVTIEGENAGLIQSGMNVKAGIKENGGTLYFTNYGKVEGYVSEDKVLSTLEAVVTKVHVTDMAFVKKGSPIITMAGSDIREIIQGKLDEVRTLRNEANDLASKLVEMDIKAPMDGIVAGFYRQPGEVARSGEWIGSLYTTSDMRMWSEVDDIDILHVKQGATVKVGIDALPDMSFEGTVSNVSSMGKGEQGVTKFMVEISIKGGPQLRPGMQARAYIDAGKADNVLLVPLEAVFEEDGKSVVEILSADGTTKVVPVKLGLMNDKLVEIKEGVKKGEKVVTGSSADLLPSQHAKTQDSMLPDVNKDAKPETVPEAKSSKSNIEK